MVTIYFSSVILILVDAAIVESIRLRMLCLTVVPVLIESFVSWLLMLRLLL